MQRFVIMFIKVYSLIFTLINMIATLRSSIIEETESKRRAFFMYTCMQIPIFVCLLYS